VSLDERCGYQLINPLVLELPDCRCCCVPGRNLCRIFPVLLAVVPPR
jgi:hypothetical protein